MIRAPAPDRRHLDERANNRRSGAARCATARNSITACDDYGAQLSPQYLDLRSLVPVIACPAGYGDNAELIRTLGDLDESLS
jgi:hypothetical protein